MTNYTKQSHVYGLTFSPKDRLFQSDERCYVHDRYHLTRLLNRVCSDFCMVPEFSTGGRIHYHGVVKIKDLIGFYKKRKNFSRKYGFLKLESFKTQYGPFPSLQSWSTYCFKDFTKSMADWLPLWTHSGKPNINIERRLKNNMEKEIKRNPFIKYGFVLSKKELNHLKVV